MYVYNARLLSIMMLCLCTKETILHTIIIQINSLSMTRKKKHSFELLFLLQTICTSTAKAYAQNIPGQISWERFTNFIQTNA